MLESDARVRPDRRDYEIEQWLKHGYVLEIEKSRKKAVRKATTR